MSKLQASLDLIEIASPCSASWDEMVGDNRVRFCRQCKLNVYNLSEMSREGADAIIDEHEGRTCVRLYRREDGTVLTRDCPVGVQAMRKRFVRAVAAIAGLLMAMISSTLFGGALTRRLPGNFESPAEAHALGSSNAREHRHGRTFLSADPANEQSHDRSHAG